MLAELDDVLTAQIAAQPDNAVLKETAADLFTGELNKPEQALTILHDLETAAFPVEHQKWLGQCSQRDFMRIRQYNLIATKPALRDHELGVLEAKKQAELARDELLELAAIRSAQGNTDSAAELLEWKPATPVEKGLERLREWVRENRKVLEGAASRL